MSWKIAIGFVLGVIAVFAAWLGNGIYGAYLVSKDIERTMHGLEDYSNIFQALAGDSILARDELLRGNRTVIGDGDGRINSPNSYGYSESNLAVMELQGAGLISRSDGISIFSEDDESITVAVDDEIFALFMKFLDMIIDDGKANEGNLLALANSGEPCPYPDTFAFKRGKKCRMMMNRDILSCKEDSREFARIFACPAGKYSDKRHIKKICRKGQWVISVDSCKSFYCDDETASLDNQSYIWAKTAALAEMEINCDDFGAYSGILQRKCSNLGFWGDIEGECIKATCDLDNLPDRDMNNRRGIINITQGSLGNIGEEKIYICDKQNGYDGTEGRLICDKSGLWIGNDTNCKREKQWWDGALSYHKPPKSNY